MVGGDSTGMMMSFTIVFPVIPRTTFHLLWKWDYQSGDAAGVLIVFSHYLLEWQKAMGAWCMASLTLTEGLVVLSTAQLDPVAGSEELDPANSWYHTSGQ